MRVKTCTKCKVEKPLNEFTTDKRASTGFKSSCKKCENAACLVRYHNNKTEAKMAKQRKYSRANSDNHPNNIYVRGIKAGGCSRCPETDIACMDMHHVGEKLFGLGTKYARKHTIEEVISECKKCVVFCANCHRKEHARLKLCQE